MDKTDIVYLLRNYERNKGNILAIMSKIEQLETIATRTTPQYENDGSQHSKYSSNSKVEKACIKIQTYNEQIDQIKDTSCEKCELELSIMLDRFAEQIRADAYDECLQIVQKIKDDYKDAKFGEQIPINYGTICGIIIALEQLKEQK